MYAVSGTTLTLQALTGAPVLAAATNVQKTVSVPGPHGGLTVVHGGGNTALEVNATVTATSNSLTRSDLLSWLDDGYQIGQLISIDGSAQTWTITGFADAPCTLPAAEQFARCGKGATMLLSAAAPSLSSAPAHDRRRRPEDRDRDRRDDRRNGHHRHAGVRRHDHPSAGWTGFKVGMDVTISGLPGTWHVTAISGNTITLSGATLLAGRSRASP